MSALTESRREEEETQARAYAGAIRNHETTLDWAAWNRHIIDRWSVTALVRIKRRAWAIIEAER